MIYIASPYTHEDPDVMQERFEEVMAFQAELCNSGYYPYSPIVQFHTTAVNHSLPRDFEYWQNINRGMIDRCDRLFVYTLPGWTKSKGVQAEIQHARGLEKPIKYVEKVGVALPGNLPNHLLHSDPPPFRVTG